MFDNKTMTITFPHVVPGNTLDGREYSFNDVDGGVKRLADFGIARNSFFGGTVTVFGLITKLGIWACQHYETRKIVGFYIDDPARVTDTGRELLRKRFSDCEVIFEKTVAKPTSVSKEELAKRDALRKELTAHGIAPEMITHTNAEALEGMLRAVLSGVADKKIATVEENVPAVYGEDKIATKATNSKINKKALFI